MTAAAPIVEGCPAFTDGCPFKEISQADGEVVKEVMAAVPQEVVTKCPAFSDGCPFKADESVEALYNRLCEMPASHRIGQATATNAASAVAATLKLVHEKSKLLKDKLKATCTVFATSCPFKTITSQGQPLVHELDDIVVQWGLLEGTDGAPAAADAAAQAAAAAAPLSKSLKAGTRSVHRAAENVRFVRDFLKGAVPKESYIELLKALYHVYVALERGLQELPAELRHCDFSAVARAETLAADLRHYMGLAPDAPLEVGPPSAAAAAYTQRLERLAKEDPLLVLAHAYTRYLGDLSGGQILAKAAVKAYDLPAGAGTEFYKFDQVGNSAADIKNFKKNYRTSLDALQLPAVQADAMVTEANLAFLMNMLLFEERDVAAGHLEKVRTLDEVQKLVESHRSPLAFQEAYGKSGGAAACPFLAQANEAKDGEKPKGVCPWPFIWLHAPRTALAMHPKKNIGAVAVLYVALKAAYRFPRIASALLFAGVPALSWTKPRKKAIKPPEKPAEKPSDSILGA